MHEHFHVPLCIKAIAWPKVAHVVHQVENKVEFHFLEKFGLVLLCCPHKAVAGVLVLVHIAFTKWQTVHNAEHLTFKED